MTTSEKAAAILQILRGDEKVAHRYLIEAQVNLEGQLARQECWKHAHENDGDGGFLINRYNTMYEEKQLIDTKERFEKSHEILEFATDHFISMIDTDTKFTRLRVQIRDGWMHEGKQGTLLGPPVYAQQNWSPVLWDGEEDPDFHKTKGLIGVSNT
jgi:hypothetical protein